ncbi:mCG145452, partial [Mus musculus]
WSLINRIAHLVQLLWLMVSKQVTSRQKPEGFSYEACCFALFCFTFFNIINKTGS